MQTGALAAPWLIVSPRLAWSAPAPRNVRDYGARGDGKANDTASIQAAIDAAPGGVVHLPPGDYVSGTLRLRDHLVLRLAAGATLIASADDTAFDPYEKLPYESFADRETTDFSFALLQGRGLQDVTIAGPGRIDGNRRSRGGPKPIALKQCRGVTIRDLTLENAPNYNISLLGCDHVDIRGVTINTQILKQLEEIKKLVQARPAAGPSGPNVKDVVFDLGANPTKGSATAKLTLVEFTDYQ